MIRSWTTIATKASKCRGTKRSAARWEMTRSSTRRRRPALQVLQRSVRWPRPARKQKNRGVQRQGQRKKLRVGRLPRPGVSRRRRDLAERQRRAVVRRRANRPQRGVRQRRARPHGDPLVEKRQKDVEAGRSAELFSGIRPRAGTSTAGPMINASRECSSS